MGEPRWPTVACLSNRVVPRGRLITAILQLSTHAIRRRGVQVGLLCAPPLVGDFGSLLAPAHHSRGQEQHTQHREQGDVYIRFPPKIAPQDVGQRMSCRADTDSYQGDC
jgi:hypothetical protein